MNDSTRAALLRASQPPSRTLFATLINANHILHHHAVCDAFGHISVRNPQNPATFFLSRSVAPALVATRADIAEYRVEDASPVDKDGAEGAPLGYVERYIHSELYKRYAGVQSVVHAHSEAVVPFSIASTPLRPVLHMAGVMGAQVPVFDIALHYKASDECHDMLINNQHLGAGLAAGFHASSLLSQTSNLLKSFVGSAAAPPPDWPSNPVVLMRGHGFTCVGDSIEAAVYRAVYTCTNARIQTTALLMQGAYNVGLVGERFGAGEKETGPAKQASVRFLDEREARDSAATMSTKMDRPWQLWCAEVENNGLYRNDLI